MQRQIASAGFRVDIAYQETTIHNWNYGEPKNDLRRPYLSFHTASANSGTSSTPIFAAIRVKNEVNSRSILWSFWQHSVYFTNKLRAGLAFDRRVCYATGDREWSSRKPQLSRFRRSKPCFLRHRCIIEGQYPLIPRSPPLRDRGEDYG